MSGTVSHFTTEHGTSLETPYRARVEELHNPRHNASAIRTAEGVRPRQCLTRFLCGSSQSLSWNRAWGRGSQGAPGEGEQRAAPGVAPNSPPINFEQFHVLYTRFSLVICFIHSIYVSLCLSTHPTSPSPPWCLYTCSLHLLLYFCFARNQPS